MKYRAPQNRQDTTLPLPPLVLLFVAAVIDVVFRPCDTLAVLAGRRHPDAIRRERQPLTVKVEPSEELLRTIANAKDTTK